MFWKLFIIKYWKNLNRFDWRKWIKWPYSTVLIRNILNTKNLKQLLEQLSGNYYLLEIDGKRCFNYNTLYYDTPLSDMFFTHIRGKLNRFKVRKRIYMETGTTYFEVKFKNTWKLSKKSI